MGIIKSEAQRAFFDSHRSNADLVKLFLNGFDIAFACEKHISNTFIYAYILKPEDFMKESFSYTINIQHLLSLVKLLNPRRIHRNVRL